jgi:hypothetical protein
MSIRKIWEDRIESLETAKDFFCDIRRNITALPLTYLKTKILEKSCKILDVGAWTWYLVRYLQNEWYYAKWIDKYRIDENIELWDIENMAFQDKEFDLIFSHLVFDENEYPFQWRNIDWVTTRKRMLSEIHRVLSPFWLYYALEPIHSKKIEKDYRTDWYKALMIPNYIKYGWKFFPKLANPKDIIL